MCWEICQIVLIVKLQSSNSNLNSQTDVILTMPTTNSPQAPLKISCLEFDFKILHLIADRVVVEAFKLYKYTFWLMVIQQHIC